MRSLTIVYDRLLQYLTTSTVQLAYVVILSDLITIYITVKPCESGSFDTMPLIMCNTTSFILVGTLWHSVLLFIASENKECRV